MGNSLTVNKSTNILELDKASILDKYINDFFANSSFETKNSEGNKILTVNYEDLNTRVDATKEQLEPLFDKHLKARACCLQQNHIPIALPYVYPYEPPEENEEDKGKIETAYPRLKVLNDYRTDCSSFRTKNGENIKISADKRHDFKART